MKILYATQATGNGHISRANEIIPLLEKKHQVDVLVSGTQSDITLNHFIRYRRKGLGFVLGEKGRIDFLKTLQRLKTKEFVEEVRSIPVEQYDFVINDFEPLSAWACKNKNVLCIAMSHQYAVTGKTSPKPFRVDPMAWIVLRYYAPSNFGIGFHFQSYDNSTFTPVIRSEIRNAYIKNHGHYTVYLPAFSDKKLIKIFSAFTEFEWHIFSKHAKKNYGEKNCWVRPITNYDFVSSFTNCEGIISAAGFETPAEALYMNKKLLVIPMKTQYEQQCNAAALEKIGVPVLKNLKKKRIKQLANWLQENKKIHIAYEDITQHAIDSILKTAQVHLKTDQKKLIPQEPVLN